MIDSIGLHKHTQIIALVSAFIAYHLRRGRMEGKTRERRGRGGRKERCLPLWKIFSGRP